MKEFESCLAIKFWFASQQERLSSSLSICSSYSELLLLLLGPLQQLLPEDEVSDESELNRDF